ncbi:NDP-sugar epimerase, includes UDP-GlcNAc-inverting 4,6-dehydratase FlaA1 and capsular polysaccharide biosynthesis protein EpsC [Sphingobacterium psychroaquaticum]|uniref:NDP-sugar epimerase, includes UDP-GlcNAc-inverting 4,6-dehydratase FlaA1 and capsular polysaccharide biosynthesis protein EpsC n=1 Tax=Sphingobacterium psychroaquaticum TaxID=561061 RepID=A0A1X7L2C2_9SPHI|nr:NDP-sugar epimerase, includes UDP-GlcNAc-inverting 4,6-dehydratase FlaA1 and capsular polysaccharide biosynthesis protein EpsC [Sphingobacterium psychroaquaticum]
MRRDNPRWVVLLIDVFIVFSCYLLSTYVINSFRGRVDDALMIKQAFLVTAIYALSFFVFKTYRGIIRQADIKDAQGIMSATIGAVVVLMLTSFCLRRSDYLPLYPIFNLSYSVVFIHGVMTIVSMVAARMVYRSIYEQLFQQGKNVAPVVLIGAGNMGTITLNLLKADSKNKYKTVLLADDNPNRIGKRVNGFNVVDFRILNSQMMESMGIDSVIIALDDNNKERLKGISEHIEQLPVKLKIMPNSAKLLSGEVATRQLRTLNIGDLLGREAIKLDNPAVQESLAGKVILITGAAGSIGSELARQIAFVKFGKLILLDQAESALYDLQQEIRQVVSHSVRYVVGNVRDVGFMENIFAHYRPHVVFHAAAYKHVPLMEQNPYESIHTNVYGSKVVADLSAKYSAEKFVMVSTDKAVNPTNVMGATKRIAEIYVSALNKQVKTNYIVTRFGNVLGSNGSVIPLFEKQLKKGGPLTVTHPDITRYFMTIPEACQLVQDAAVMGSGGEIYVFDMGEPVKIMDLAKRMIRLKGYRYPEDVSIMITGLRPGEKTYEELLANDENTVKTHHEKIMIAKVNTFDDDQRKEKIEMLCLLIKDCQKRQEPMTLVSMMKDIVPEFVSKNSIFEELDPQKAV